MILLVSAWAGDFQPDAPRGDETKVYGDGAICVVPKHLDGADYRKKDRGDEEELCGYDFDNDDALGVCPKLHSTQPGLELHALEGVTKGPFEEQMCSVVSKGGGRKAKKLAKFKQSIHCSYVPSILGYYHVSRMLGNVARVPVSVVRTVERTWHLGVAEDGVKYAHARYPGQLIETNWAEVRDKLREGTNDTLLVGDFSYGALSDNPRGEEHYTELRGKKGWDHFETSTVYAELTRLKLPVDNSFSQENVQKLQRYKDVVDMMVLDYLLQQTDRRGNVHYKDAWLRIDEGELKRSKTADKGGVRVKQLLLKDNDCGVAKHFYNEPARKGYFDQVRHIDPETYRRVQWMRTADLETFFREELLFTDNDWTRQKKRIDTLGELLARRCESGALRLDLNLEQRLTSNPAPIPCR